MVVSSVEKLTCLMVVKRADWMADGMVVQTVVLKVDNLAARMAENWVVWKAVHLVVWWADKMVVWTVDWRVDLLDKLRAVR